MGIKRAISVFIGKKGKCRFYYILCIATSPRILYKAFLGNTFSIAAVATQCAFVLVFGLLFGYLYRKEKSLWSPMLVHFLADFLGVMMIG